MFNYMGRSTAVRQCRGARIAPHYDPNDVAKAMMVIAAVKVNRNNAIFTVLSL